jgi:molybdate/tungstate transport system ATP-binding protein
MIAVDGLTMRVGSFAIDNLSLSVDAGQYAVLMGPTGCGKTTLLEAICGLKRIRAGRIRLRDGDVSDLPPADRGIAYVPQDLALFPTHTVRDHLTFALELRRWRADEMDRRVAELTKVLGLEGLLDRTPQGLSGGESQRVALGRALSFRPAVLLMDEPLSALDDETREGMYALLRSVRRQTGVTTLHVTHSRAEAQALADRLFLFECGTLREAPAPTRS